jgi:hypothetical protein
MDNTSKTIEEDIEVVKESPITFKSVEEFKEYFDKYPKYSSK